ncbi:MAG: dihydrofolate reductase [Phycisphaerales bacterium]|jgi:dihydrofolate reductase|nr:dihydrofolate reductase [Phycisphaerales bacterium]MDP6890175.1 dihydrofolate reductase [Phycisphaerales bacterium]
MGRPQIVLVTAVSDNGVIGRGGDMPWHLPDDLRRFKKLTMGHPIVMGRRTWDSIGRPLPGRTNIVMTRDTSFAAEGAVVAHSEDDIFAAAGDADTIMVIGGGEIYRIFLPNADRVELTRVHITVDGDTLFPELGDEWVCVESVEHSPGMSFETWRRKSGSEV